jgi:hypothetical protein
MRVPLSWLKEFVRYEGAIAELAHRLAILCAGRVAADLGPEHERVPARVVGNEPVAGRPTNRTNSGDHEGSPQSRRTVTVRGGRYANAAAHRIRWAAACPEL